MKRMGELSDAEVRAANVTAAQSLAVLRQASYELSRGERLHEDVTYELEIARQSWNASMQGSHLDGYNQQLGLYPFHVVFFTEQQILAYIGQCKSKSGAVVHVDATGSIINRVPDQKTPYYYCLLLSDGSLQIMEFISCCHEAAWLQSLLLSFNSAVRRVNSGRLVTPRFMVIHVDSLMCAGNERRHADCRLSGAHVRHSASSLQRSEDEACHVLDTLRCTHDQSDVHEAEEGGVEQEHTDCGDDVLRCSTALNRSAISGPRVPRHSSRALHRVRDVRRDRRSSPTAVTCQRHQL